jgi:hypothetical protein
MASHLKMGKNTECTEGPSPEDDEYCVLFNLRDQAKTDEDHLLRIHKKRPRRLGTVSDLLDEMIEESDDESKDL